MMTTNESTQVTIAEASLAIIRRYLDEVMYSLVDFRLSFEAPTSPTGFPRFEMLQKVVARLDVSHRTLFRLLRLGESVEDADVQASIPPDVLAAFAQKGLLVRGETDEWSTPNLLLVPVEGMLIFVSIPPSYLTAAKACHVWFDLSSFVIAKMLPSSLAGERVLDICSGSGIQSLLCAARGAASITGLEITGEAIELARLNAVLNGVSEQINFRNSDKLAALGDDEQFDFIICNTPYAPVIAGSEPPLALDEIGNSVLLGLLEELPKHLSERGRGILAAWRSMGTASTTSQRERIVSQLAKANLSTLAFVDRAPDTVEGVLRTLQTDIEQRHDAQRAEEVVASVRELLRNSGDTVDGFYNQLIFFKRGHSETAEEAAVFGLAAPQA